MDEENIDDNDEYVEETDEDGEVTSTDQVKKLKSKLKEVEIKAQEYLTGWQKERAEAVNIRKRLEEEKREFAKYVSENLIMELLPALDSFDMAMGNKAAWAKVPPEWAKGMEYIHSQLLSALESQGVKRIYPLHSEFDPSEHDAMGTIDVSDKKDDNKVLEVIQPGYSMQGKIIRTAKVKVGEHR